MKKLLFAAFVGLVLCACDDNVVTIGTITEPVQPTRSSEMEIIISNTKGFITRGCDTSGNMWEYMPKYPTAEEKAEVMAYIKENSDKYITVTDWQWQYYYIQHLDGAHNKYEYEDWNHSWHRDIDGTSNLNNLQVLEFSGNWQHVYNFNSGKCENQATHDCSLMTDGFKGARSHESYGSKEIETWRLYEYKGQFYLGFDYSMTKDDGQVPADGVYDDWVVKIIPAKGETEASPVSTYLPEGAPDDDPEGGDPEGNDPEGGDDPDSGETTPELKTPHVEFDVHQQQHTDWNEIKTSIHLRDTVNCRIFLPIPEEYQAPCDDFDIRTGEDYKYLSESLSTQFSVVSNDYNVVAEVNHLKEGIEILIKGADLAGALRDARGVYDDGITFEIHSYVKPSVLPEQLWSWLRNTERIDTSLEWPFTTGNVTTTFGQVTSAYFMNEGVTYEPLK